MTAAPVVTALRAHGPSSSGVQRVAVDLDGRPWRVVPLEAVLRAGLLVGAELDRGCARTLARELRRIGARDTALRALRRRDESRASLERRLARRGTTKAVRDDTLDALERVGLVDDGRFARRRAELLAERGAGDAMIAADLERHGVPAEAVRDAVGELEPESARAALIAARRGHGPRTLRYLAARGFSDDALDALVADQDGDGLG